MPRDGLPDLVIVGDSHTAALQQAALARGLDSRMLYINGNFWHENKMRPHATMGISGSYRPKLNKQMVAFAAELGGSVFPQGVPVLASFGYHLGRMSPPFARHGHTPDAAQAMADGSRLFTSQAFCDAYIAHHRGSLLRILRLVSRVSSLVVVAPPVVQHDPGTLYLARRITEQLRAARVAVFDPRDEPGLNGALPADMLAPDGVHGNAAYGEEVLRRLFDKGLIHKAA